MKFFATITTSTDEVSTMHKEICERLPVSTERVELGEFYSCSDALDEAKKRQENSNGCFYCCLLSYTKKEYKINQ